MTVPDRPLLVYDGECSFCLAWIARWRRLTGERVAYAPSQEVAAVFPDIPPERFRNAVHLIEPDGRHSDGAEAVFRSLAYAPGGGAWLWLYRFVPGFAPVSEWVYRYVAGHRPGLERLTRWIWGPHLVPPGETHTVWWFLRLLGLVYGIAFVSFWVQAKGLIGSQGILPITDHLDAIRGRFGVGRYWLAPTLAWLGTSDAALQGLCAAGTALAALLAVGITPVPCLIGAWALYLSLTVAGQEFMWFQWDGLLLEAGFLSILLAPMRLWSRPGSDPPPPRAALWLLRWLLFRLMFSSAAVKLTSGDPSWRSLTALEYHYETQCLPPWTAWYVHHAPARIHLASCVAMLAVEGLVPFLILAPRRVRFAAAAALAGLQLVIALTGNYGFFNLLSIALCVLLLDDGVWPWRWRPRPPPAAVASRAEENPRSWPPRRVLRPVAVTMVLLTLVPLWGALRWPFAWLGPLPSLYRLASPFRMVNGYGLFAIMTTRRTEIILEGSHDGTTWRVYPFRWKPGDLGRRPAFVAPHQPRLDWQMWFAALDDYRGERWFLLFCRRLLLGSPTVLALLERNPFPEGPPRYLRATAYDYHFSDATARRTTGAWWRREPRGLYCPVLMVDAQGSLVAAP